MAVYTIHHITKYQYKRPVKESNNEIKIYPYPFAEQEVMQHQVHISNNPDVYIYTDYWGNRVGLFNILEQHKELVIDSRLTIRNTSKQLPSAAFEKNFIDLKNEINQNIQLIELSLPEAITSVDIIQNIITGLQLKNKSVAQVVEDCSSFIYNNFKYIKGITTIETTVDEILQVKAGVCQDFAHLLLQMLRTLSIPCRYVSGYICPNKNGMRGEGATHAWVEAYIPNYGFTGIDPTNNIWVSNTYIKLSVGTNFNHCTPVKGTFKGGTKQTLSVYVSVGYEDGHSFEEHNNVQMQLTPAQAEQERLEDIFEQQQQQQ